MDNSIHLFSLICLGAVQQLRNAFLDNFLHPPSPLVTFRNVTSTTPCKLRNACLDPPPPPELGAFLP